MVPAHGGRAVRRLPCEGRAANYRFLHAAARRCEHRLRGRPRGAPCSLSPLPKSSQTLTITGCAHHARKHTRRSVAACASATDLCRTCAVNVGKQTPLKRALKETMRFVLARSELTHLFRSPAEKIATGWQAVVPIQQVGELPIRRNRSAQTAQGSFAERIPRGGDRRRLPASVGRLILPSHSSTAGRRREDRASYSG